MKLPKLRRGLFGYTENSVREYLACIDNEVKAKIGDCSEHTDAYKQQYDELQRALSQAQAENEALQSKNAEMESEIAEMANKIEYLTKQLDIQNQLTEEARRDKTDYEKEQNDLVAVMVEAKKFSDDLKQQARDDFNRKIADNNAKIRNKISKIDECVKNIDELYRVLQTLNSSFAENVSEKRGELLFLSKTLRDLEEEPEAEESDSVNSESILSAE